MNTCSMIGFFPACLFGVKKGLQILGENCFWMLGYSELYQPALTTSAHNNLPFFWNGLQLSYAIQRRDKKVILYASRLPIFTSILPLQYLFFPNINYAFCKWLQILNCQTKMRKVAQPCFILGFFFFFNNFWYCACTFFLCGEAIGAAVAWLLHRCSSCFHIS